jgi:RecJ-like exonuclease
MPEKTEVFVCPVCQGRGTVPDMFYSWPIVEATTSSSVTMAICRACNGKGYVVVRTTEKEAEQDARP